MSTEEQKQEAPVADLPKGFPPELIPLYDFWKKNGTTLIVSVLVAVVAFVSYNTIKNRRAAAAVASSEAVAYGSNSYVAPTAEEFDGLAAKFADAKSGAMLKVRQAKAHFDQKDYDGAIAIYDSIKDLDPAFAGIVKIGRAYALEGKGDNTAAAAAFAEYVAAAADDDAFKFVAQLGAARAKGIGGDKEGAVKELKALKEQVKDDEAKAARVDDMIDVVERHRSIIELSKEAVPQAEAAEKAVEAEKK